MATSTGLATSGREGGAGAQTAATAMDTGSSTTRSGRLKSGRHGLTRAAVVASQRGRLLDAMAQVVAEKGYATVTVADIVERAEVSRRTFYEQFADKEECLLAAFDIGVELLMGRIRDAAEVAGDAGWPESARVGVQTYLGVLAEEPAFTWSLHVEMFGAGPRPLARRAEVITMFAEGWRALHERALPAASRPDVPAAAYRVLTVGIEELVREHVRLHGAASLDELLEPALGVALTLLGPGAG